MLSSENTSCTTATNWTIVAGSFDTSLTFESSLSQINDDENHDQYQSSTVDSISKSPLIFSPPSPDSTPCEITITFSQKHEVQQVYIRSTARVYEIYYAPEPQSSSEYLCTVRCGIATRDGEVLQTTDIEEAVLAHLKGSTKEIADEKLRNSSNLTSSDDDWVEVKALDTTLTVNRNSPLSSDSDINPGRSSQDFYEATAEVTDATPCMSLTLRLLSLQNKDSVCVDEVYVFADPVDAAALDNQVGLMENSAGSSLMAMLVPAFYQLSKTKGVGRAQDKHDIDTREKQKSEEFQSKATDPMDIGNKIQQEVKFQETVGNTAKPVQLGIHPEVSDTEGKANRSHSRIEDVLDQLVSRVSKIENLFVRFEESMLKPISSIDERLQRVEQQLELLTKKTENSEMLACTRISTPELSCSESEANSFYNSGSRHLSCVACEANKRDSPSGVSSIPPDAIPLSVNAMKLHPSLVVIAPEFSNYDDEEENHAVEPVEESPMDKQKHTVSIDNALASALAGLLSSTSIQSQKYSQTLSVKAPEFPCDEESNNDKTASPRVHSEIITDPPTCFGELVVTEHMRRSFSSSSNISSLGSDENVTRSLNQRNSMKITEGDDEQWQHGKGEEGDFESSCVDTVLAPAQDHMERTESYQITDDISLGDVGNGMSNFSVLENSESLEKFSGNRTDDDSDATQEGAFFNESITSNEVTEEGSNNNIQQNVVEFSQAASIMDYETSILEVKFVSEENSNAKSSLEVLLAGMPDLEVEGPSVGESGTEDYQIGDQYNLISVEDWGLMGSATDSHVSVDMEYCSLRDMPLNMAADKLQDCCTCTSREMPEASLI